MPNVQPRQRLGAPSDANTAHVDSISPPAVAALAATSVGMGSGIPGCVTPSDDHRTNNKTHIVAEFP